VVEELRERQKVFSNHEGIRSCIGYIENRPSQFEYQKAIALGLPIRIRESGKQPPLRNAKTVKETWNLVVKREC
jgi:hypothetical protein